MSINNVTKEDKVNLEKNRAQIRALRSTISESCTWENEAM